MTDHCGIVLLILKACFFIFAPKGLKLRKVKLFAQYYTAIKIVFFVLIENNSVQKKKLFFLFKGDAHCRHVKSEKNMPLGIFAFCIVDFLINLLNDCIFLELEKNQ